MQTSEYREIPFNYTSASDAQIVTFVFGPETWSVLEQLRERRFTGRSARLLLRFMGDMFMPLRSPFLRQRQTSRRWQAADTGSGSPWTKSDGDETFGAV